MSEYLRNSSTYHVETFVPWLSTCLYANPASVTESVLDRAKYAAKLLSQLISINHCRALEVVSNGLGFSTWFDFKKHLREVTAGKLPSDDWRKKMALALLLLGSREPDVRIPREHLRGLELIARRISNITGNSLTEIQDQILSRLCSAGTWAEVLNRSPLQTSRPLYFFSVQSGKFEESAACEQLSEDMQVIIDDSDNDKLEAWLKFTLAAQPTFVEAALQLGHYYLITGHASKAIAVTALSADHIFTLVPDEYDGSVSWWHGHNRPFLRLLYNRMLAYQALGRFADALLTAEDLLALSPCDGIEVRLAIPKLLKSLGRRDLAQEWTKYVRKGSIWHPFLRDKFLSELVNAPVD